jgi:hypothetical protein
MVILAGRRDKLKIEMEVERIHKIYHTANLKNLAFLTPQHQRNRKLTVEFYNGFTRVSKPVIYKMFTA